MMKRIIVVVTVCICLGFVPLILHQYHAAKKSTCHQQAIQLKDQPNLSPMTRTERTVFMQWRMQQCAQNEGLFSRITRFLKDDLGAVWAAASFMPSDGACAPAFDQLRV